MTAAYSFEENLRRNIFRSGHDINQTQTRNRLAGVVLLGATDCIFHREATNPSSLRRSMELEESKTINAHTQPQEGTCPQAAEERSRGREVAGGSYNKQ